MGKEEFVSSLNSQLGCLPFWDILIIRSQDGTLGRSIYRKLTHTHLYINNELSPSSSEESSVATLVNWAL